MNNQKTYIDFIFKNKIITINLLDDKKINKILSFYFTNINKLLFLDFHGVADLYDEPFEQIPFNLPKCIISYLGNNPKTKHSTIKSIKNRLELNEIILGILVYTKDNYPSCGTKGWIINKILLNNLNIKKIYFIDDSITNINCVKKINNPYIKTFFINKKSNLLPKEQLNKILLLL